MRTLNNHVNKPVLGKRTFQHQDGSRATAMLARFTDLNAIQNVVVARDLYGFIPARSAADFASDGHAFRFRCIVAGNVAALAGPPSFRLPVRKRERQTLSRLRAYQRALEEVMRRSPILPVRFGCRFPGRSVITRLLVENQEELSGAISAYGHLLQVEIQVSGPRMSADADSRIVAARVYIRRELKALGLAMHEDTTEAAGVILCVTLLIHPLDEPRLDAALARLDGEFGGWLHFTSVGPLPPCGFARVIVCSPNPSASPRGAWTLTVNSTLPASA